MMWSWCCVPTVRRAAALTTDYGLSRSQLCRPARAGAHTVLPNKTETQLRARCSDIYVYRLAPVGARNRYISELNGETQRQHLNSESRAGKKPRFLTKRDYVMFGYMLSHIRVCLQARV